MHINATFLIQIINFVVTYYILNRFLFKPIIASIKRKHEKEIGLKKSIKKEENKIVTLEKEKHEVVLSFQRNMKKKFPYISPIIQDKPVDVEAEKAFALLTQEKIDKKTLQKEVTKFLIERVPHEY
jgi:F0F1-type ATP synthase membrane subunit b/b'